MKTSKYSVGGVLCAIGLSVIASIAFYISFLLSTIIVYFIYSILGETISSILVNISDNTPTSFATIISCYVGYFAIDFSAERIMMKEATKKLTFIFLGISLSIFNLLYLILNIYWGDPFFPNIGIIVVGIIFFFKGKNMYIPD